MDSNKGRRELRVVFAGGGTGGHLYPAIALAEAFQKRAINFSCVFIGTRHGLEAGVIPQLGYPLHRIWMRGLLRKLSPANLLFPLRLAVATMQCRRLYGCFGPHVVIGTGGYVSGPALLAARWCKIRYVVQEQNSYPGLATRWLGRWADAVFLTFEESRKFFRPLPGPSGPVPQGPSGLGQGARVGVVGNPVRGSLQRGERDEALRKWKLRPEATTMLVFGGSQGARRINQTMLQMLPGLRRQPSLQVLWVTGPASFAELQAQCQEIPSLRLFPYLQEMSLAYAAADFVICRSGATTLAELALCGLPSILIPFPFATADHQTFNAAAMQRAGAAIMIAEKELTAELLLEKVLLLLGSPPQRQEMAQAARSQARPRAADDIVDFCLELAETT